jgi:hypothetical protein
VAGEVAESPGAVDSIMAVMDASSEGSNDSSKGVAALLFSVLVLPSMILFAETTAGLRQTKVVQRCRR